MFGCRISGDNHGMEFVQWLRAESTIASLHVKAAKDPFFTWRAPSSALSERFCKRQKKRVKASVVGGGVRTTGALVAERGRDSEKPVLRDLIVCTRAAGRIKSLVSTWL